MTRHDHDIDDESTLIDEVIAEYISSEDAGTSIDREALMAEHPRLEPELRQFFRDRDRFRKAARPLSMATSQCQDRVTKLRYFGDFEILEEIATGGMGVVYKARQTSLNRLVAVKMILAAQLASDEDTRRFREEAETAAGLRHRSIVPIHEVGTHKGQHYFSMEYIDGGNLADRIRTKPPTFDEAAAIMKGVAEALDYAHQQGTVHRDVKPSNILLDQDGLVHITDFGLAMRVEGDSELTRTGQVMGTPGYMSPEQAEANRALIGAGSDVYSLGAVLYELLTGRPPFRAESAVATIRQVVENEPIPPGRLNAATPLDLETICLKCLQKEPHKRYGTAALLSDDLGRWLAGEPIHARPVNRTERLIRWCRRNPLVASLSSLTMVSLIGVATIATLGYLRESELHTAADGLRRRAESGEQATKRALSSLKQTHTDLTHKHQELEAEQATNRSLNQTVADLARKREMLRKSLSDGERDLAENRIRLARSEWLAGDVVRADKYLEQCPEAFRNREWQQLKRLWLPESIDLPGRTCVVFDASGKRVAFGGREGHTVEVWNVTPREQVWSFEGHTHQVTAVAFNGDGTLLASAGNDRTVRLWSLDNGTLLHTFVDHSVEVTDVTFSPDGHRLASASLHVDRTRNSPRGEVLIWNLKRRELERRLDGMGRVAFSPNGSLVAFRSSEKTAEASRPVIDVIKVDEPDKKVLLHIPCSSTRLAPPVFSPDGTSIAVAVPPRDALIELESLEIWNLATSQLHQRLSVDFHIHAMAFSPDANRLACGGRDGFSEAVSTTFQTVTFNLITGERDRVFPWYQRTVVNLAYDADGMRLATATPLSVKVWDVTPPSDPTEALYADIAELDVGPKDWPQWGGSKARINTPAGKNIPIDWDIGEAPERGKRQAGQVPKGSRNIKWVVPLGTQTYGNPVVANGRIFVGTNNGAGYLDYYPPNIDLGVLLCFEEQTGKFLWQHSNEKLKTGRVHDWPEQGVCSTPVVDGNRLWYVSNRGEVVCLDTDGFHDGEDDGVSRRIVGEEWVRCFSIPTVMHNDMDRLRDELGNVGVKLSKSDGIRKSSQGWSIGRYGKQNGQYQWIQSYAVRVTDGLLKVLQLTEDDAADLTAEVLSVSDDLLPGLYEGQLDPILRTTFDQVGVALTEGVQLTPGQSDSDWTVTGTMFGTERMFRLKVENKTLVCTRQLTMDDRDEADVVWKLDMMNELGVSQHNMAQCSMITVDGKLFVCTSNGLDVSHINLPAPDAPSFIALDRDTGKLLWSDKSPGRNILHAQWASPSYGVFDGQPQVIFPGGDGWVYSFDPKGDNKGGSRLIWKFDANPKESKWIIGGRGTRNNIIAFPAIYDGLIYIVVGQDPEHGEGQGRLWCIDPTKRMDGSDVSAELAVDADGNIIPHRREQAVNVDAGERAVPNPKSAVRWTYTSQDRNEDGKIDFLEEFHRSISIPVIKDDILYVADFSGLFHCLNAKTGKVYWTYDMFAACWGSALLVDGHVYICDEDGDVAAFRHSAEPNVAMLDKMPGVAMADTLNARHPVNARQGQHRGDDGVNSMGNAVYMTPIVANDVLYVVSKSALYAIARPGNE